MPSIRRIISLLACASVTAPQAPVRSFQAVPETTGCQCLAIPKVVLAAVNPARAERW